VERLAKVYQDAVLFPTSFAFNNVIMSESVPNKTQTNLKVFNSLSCVNSTLSSEQRPVS